MFIRGETLSAHSARPSKIPGWIVVVREFFFFSKQAGFEVINMNSRFAEVSEKDVTILVKEGVPQKTKEATSYAVKVFEGK